jgi:peptidylprolyl isomerase
MSELKLEITDRVIGTGKEALKGALVKINYIGTLEDGTVFDSTQDHGRMFQFVVGAKRVIQGLDQGILGMKEGGKRRIWIPSALAYGERSVGKIPPNSNLIFEIDLNEAWPRE